MIQEQSSNILKCLYSADSFDAQDRNIIQDLKQQIQKKQNGNIIGQYYVTHQNSWKALLSFLFFSFADQKSYETKNIKAILKRIDESEKNIPTIMRDKFKINFNNDDSLPEKVYQKQNLIQTNRALLEKCEEILEDKDYQKFIRSGLNNSPLSFQDKIPKEKEWSLIKKNLSNWVVLLKGHDSYILAIYSSNGSVLKSLLKDEGTSFQKKQINSDDETGEVEIDIEKEKQIQIDATQTNFKKKKAKTYESEIVDKVDFSTLKKSHSQSERDSLTESEREDGYEITWFETTVLVLIFLAVACQLGNIFDIFLKVYNEYIGHYFLLEGGYHLQNWLYPTN